MTHLEALFRDKHPDIDAVIEHSPMRARFLLLSFLYNQRLIEEQEEQIALTSEEESEE